MRSIVCERPNVFKMTNEKAPSIRPGEALVRIKRIGICGTDLHAYKGNQPFFSYPRVLGHELSGVIEEVEHNPEGLQAGDRVAIIPYLSCGNCHACRNGKTNCCTKVNVLGVHIDGGMRELVAVPTKQLMKTTSLSYDEAALIEPLAIGAHAVNRAKPRRNEQVLVIGAGPIGLGVMLFAKEQGARVIAMDVNEERLEFCQQWAKVDAVVHALDNPLSELNDRLNDELPTIVFDATGNNDSMTEAFNYVAHGGKLVYVGLVNGMIQFDDPEFHKREMTLMASRNATKEDFNYVIQVLETGSIQLDLYITHRCSFREMVEQFDSWLLPESKVIKVVVEL
ncbi:zinc-binding alcohol dehydrogenase family protein [Shouchella clausii]|uniref:Zinc-binding alcohol dehydrogenase family protein n=1 Tax=Shouchella rhizosphaerae TaxID=866786 RepID=A0ABZ2CPC2_9BACI|nr:MULTISPECIES: zinc-binding alcohol dehydrogenase family protein [Shouchella]ALA52437.1 Sorbitol dehydrogenase [Shouchella clausii]MBU3230142.1 zinc-binding alcohol dehydrogenase family protein [Shouchella clausii]MBU3262659.1 zinc-binding alcohol dehydrogenase family protein [Shouchella clausii]MBU3507025.1 zinc-binding alcohol dehydrogenase family protein [Shouchella clausii]MBU3533166.1 zinc-binding alcohol dehydrogenase family protein [Shouchella clausii]